MVEDTSPHAKGHSLGGREPRDGTRDARHEVIFVREGQAPAMPEDDGLSHPTLPARETQGAQHVLGHKATGVSQHLGVARGEPQEAERGDARIPCT